MASYVTLALLVAVVSSASAKSPLQKLLVVSYDGFRADYLDLYKDLTPVLNRLKRSSSHAKCLLNVFPTQTFPNHFSIATGLYPEIHGVLGSKVYDNDLKTLLSYGYNLFHYNKNITPIWTLNEKGGQGRHSGVVMWPGSEFEYGNVETTFKRKFDEGVSFKERVNSMISWFTHPTTPANFVMMYFEEPDEITHAFGPYSPVIRDQIKLVDDTTQYILDSLENNNLTDVNVIFLSDHGMEGVTVDRIIDLRPIVGDIADMYGTSPVLQVYPKAGSNVSKVYGKLKAAAKKDKRFKVYLQAKIPTRFHMKKCRRAPPILALADPPYAFQDLYAGIEWYHTYKNATKNGTYGVHGYDPRDVNMHPYFIAHGPLFKENYYAGELRTIDMYSMFSHILDLQEPVMVKPNGTFSKVHKIFKPAAKPQKVSGGKKYWLPLWDPL